MKSKELYFFLKTLIFSLLMAYLVLGKQAFTNSTIDINLHDSYYIIQTYLITFSIILPIFFVAYLVRVLKRKLDIVTVNVISILSTTFLILLIFSFYRLFPTTLSYKIGLIDNLPPSQNKFIQELENTYRKIKTFLIIIQIILSFYLVFISYKTVQIYRKRKSAI